MNPQNTKQKTKRRHVYVRSGLLLLAILLLLFLFWWMGRTMSQVNSAVTVPSTSGVSAEELKNYVADHALTPESRLSDEQLMKKAQEAALRVVGTRVESLKVTTSKSLQAAPKNSTTVNNISTTNQLITNALPYVPGNGIKVEGNTIRTDLSDMVTSADISDGSVSFNDLNVDNCSDNTVLKVMSGVWNCGSDLTAVGSSVTGTPGRLAYFSGPTSLANSYLSQDGTGVVVDTGKSLTVNGMINGNGSGLTNLDGGQLLASSITSSQILDGSIGNTKLADGVITLAKLGQNTCSNAQTIKWLGVAWGCGVDDNTTYTVGPGLSSDQNQFSLDTAQANVWSGLQTFEAGLSLNNTTYTSLLGDGLALNGGVLSSLLGTSISETEIDDGTITLQKLASSSCNVADTVKWSGSGWQCALDNYEQYTTGAGLYLSNTQMALDTGSANTWSALQAFDGGMSLDGNSYTSLLGDGLAIASGTLSSVLGTSVDTNELTNNAVTSTKILDGTVATADLKSGAVITSTLADGAVTLTKLAQNSCTDTQTIKWTGGGWACSGDNNSQYVAGSGLGLVGNTFALDTSTANQWSGLQTFTSGLVLGGTTLTNLAGTGLIVTNGILASSLGTSIENSEITDGTITLAKLGQITAYYPTRLSGAVLDGVAPLIITTNTPPPTALG